MEAIKTMAVEAKNKVEKLQMEIWRLEDAGALYEALRLTKELEILWDQYTGLMKELKETP